MRRQTGRGAWWGAGLCLAVLVGGGGAVAQEPGREACAELARSLKDLEAQGLRDYLGRDPASLDGGVHERMRAYIALREMVLFRCPPNVLNATAAPLSERLAQVPPLPGKGPKLIVRQAPKRLVPLPVRRPI